MSPRTQLLKTGDVNLTMDSTLCANSNSNLVPSTSIQIVYAFAPRRGQLETGDLRSQATNFDLMWFGTLEAEDMCRRIWRSSRNFEQLALGNAGWKFVRIYIFVAKVVASGACNWANMDAEWPKWYQSTEKASIFAGAKHLEASWTRFWWLVEHPEPSRTRLGAQNYDSQALFSMLLTSTFVVFHFVSNCNWFWHGFLVLRS